MALTATIGERFPLHAGAASKVLLANMPDAARTACLAAPLRPYSARTITDPELLRRELARIRQHGWAEDRGEFSVSVRAVAAPVRDGQGNVVAAVSLAHLADRGAAAIRRFRVAVCRAAVE
jgi:DNA-binding IclR family transcriptional regulator